jgi:hypothetical protein
MMIIFFVYITKLVQRKIIKKPEQHAHSWWWPYRRRPDYHCELLFYKKGRIITLKKGK